MKKVTIQGRLRKAASKLLQNQANLFQLSGESRQTEWNLAHQLGNEIRQLFKSYDCDLDIAKPNLRNKRPDIILHKRGSQKSNLLVIEVKRRKADAAQDLEKIRQYWFTEPLKYQFGAVVVFDRDEPLFIRVIKNHR